MSPTVPGWGSGDASYGETFADVIPPTDVEHDGGRGSQRRAGTKRAAEPFASFRAIGSSEHVLANATTS